MAITGYHIYRYKDTKDPKLTFDIIIFDSDELSSAGFGSIEIPLNIKIPFFANTIGHVVMNHADIKSGNLTVTHNDQNGGYNWNYGKISTRMLDGSGMGTASSDTGGITGLYGLIIKYNGRYYTDYSSEFKAYDYPPPYFFPDVGYIFNGFSSLSYVDGKSIDYEYPFYAVGMSTYSFQVDPARYEIAQSQFTPNAYPRDFEDCTDIIKAVLGDSKEIDTKDPHPGGGDSKPGGGGGGGDIGGDTNPDDGLPTISALDSGLLTAYNPTVGQLQSLGQFLWSDSFNLDSFKKLFNDPFDTLLGLSVVPVKPNTSGTKNIMFGNMDSGVSAPVVSNQWVPKDMGSVTLNEVWKGALDYAPSTGVTIYLPFIGMRQLNVNDVMGSTLHLIYKFDVLTGSCIAQIYVNHNSQGNKDDGFSWTKNQGLLYEFIGQCAENIPLASQDFTNTIRAAIGGVAVATGAAASIATGNPALGIAGLTVGAANLGMQASTPTVERGGHLSGSASILGYSQPFLIVERPHQCKPSRYYALRGVPSQVYTSKLSKCTNFTQITANNNLHIAGASDSELTELQNLLVSGVYFPDKKR